MMPIDITGSIFALFTGVFLGGFYFMGLRWTVGQLGASQNAALLFLGSLLFRTGVVIVGFYFILGDNWQGLVAGLLGFVLVRVLAIRLTLHAGKIPAQNCKSGYAP